MTDKKDKIKSVVIYVVAALLVIGGLIKGMTTESKESKEGSETEETAEQEPSSDSSETDNNMVQDEEGAEEVEEGNSLDEYEMDIEDLPEEERNYKIENRKEMADFFDEKSISETKKVGKKFVEHYHQFNGEKPQDNIENSKEYMTQKLYETVKGDKESITRPTKDFFERRVKKIEMREPRTFSDEVIMWEVRVNAEILGESGDKTDELLTVYTLKFDEVDGNYKVSDFSTDVPY